LDFQQGKVGRAELAAASLSLPPTVRARCCGKLSMTDFFSAFILSTTFFNSLAKA
jgi:hypothetical protein